MNALFAFAIADATCEVFASTSAGDLDAALGGELHVLVRKGLGLDLDPDPRVIGRVVVEAVAVDPTDLPRP